MTEPTLTFPADVREPILERARDGVPHEVCGVYGGLFDPDSSDHERSGTRLDGTFEREELDLE